MWWLLLLLLVVGDSPAPAPAARSPPPAARRRHPRPSPSPSPPSACTRAPPPRPPPPSGSRLAMVATVLLFRASNSEALCSLRASSLPAAFAHSRGSGISRISPLLLLRPCCYCAPRPPPPVPRPPPPAPALPQPCACTCPAGVVKIGGTPFPFGVLPPPVVSPWLSKTAICLPPPLPTFKNGTRWLPSLPSPDCQKMAHGAPSRRG
jgi:hypothetical protein